MKERVGSQVGGGGRPEGGAGPRRGGPEGARPRVRAGSQTTTGQKAREPAVRKARRSDPPHYG